MRSLSLSILLSGMFMAAGMAAMAKGEEKAEATEARTKDCLMLTYIKDADVISDQAIIFTMKNGDVFRNDLPHHCPHLDVEKTFDYRVSNQRLCRHDLITVRFNGSLQNGPSCALGKFTQIEAPSSQKDAAAQ